MSGHRPQHRLRPRRTPLRIPALNPLWWLLPLALVVSAGVVTTALQLPGPVLAPPQTAVAATSRPRPDPTTTEASRAFLAALAAHHVAVEPHQAVFYGGAVCDQRHRYNANLATLSLQLRGWAPWITPIDVATLVDDADRHLC